MNLRPSGYERLQADPDFPSQNRNLLVFKDSRNRKLPFHLHHLDHVFKLAGYKLGYRFRATDASRCRTVLGTEREIRCYKSQGHASRPSKMINEEGSAVEEMLGLLWLIYCDP